LYPPSLNIYRSKSHISRRDRSSGSNNCWPNRRLELWFKGSRDLTDNAAGDFGLEIRFFVRLACLVMTLAAVARGAETRSETAPGTTPHSVPGNRVASVYISEDFINQQIEDHMKSDLIKKFTVKLDPENDKMLLRGVLQIPVEELRAVNLDPKLGQFRFQVSVRPKTTKHGHLILEFPLDETYFYPVNSKNPKRDRVIVPVQMLSLALASARGYLAALSGDFAGFDRRTTKLSALVKALDRAIASEQNPDALDDLKTQRESLRLQLAAVPLERKQLKNAAKEVEGLMGFTGEKEISLNNELAARDNALILKIKLSQLVPYLEGVELGGVRILHDKKDGNGQNYMAIDVNATLAPDNKIPAMLVTKPSDRPGMKVPPSLIVRLNQSILESEALMNAEKKEMSSKLKHFDIQLKDDGLHVSGSWQTFFFSIPFDTIVDFVTTGTDVFEVRVREIKVAGIDFDFLTKFVLESLKKRLDQSLKNICSFEYVGEEKDHSRALQVKIEPAKLVPAVPNMHLVAVDVREREFLLKIGQPEL
jgi:hypothetical protein